jgi:hypothetical protein
MHLADTDLVVSSDRHKRRGWRSGSEAVQRRDRPARKYSVRRAGTANFRDRVPTFPDSLTVLGTQTVRAFEAAASPCSCEPSANQRCGGEVVGWLIAFEVQRVREVDREWFAEQRKLDLMHTY